MSAFNKRELLKLLGGSALGAFFAQRTPAKSLEVLGIKIPEEITAIIPEKPLAIMTFARDVFKLELEADSKGLPPSPLALHKGESLETLNDNLYQMAMPRLVALIDRSEAIDPAIADKAGALLAQLHATEHVIPDAFRSMLTVAAPQSDTRPLLSLDDQHAPSLSLPPVIISPPVTVDSAPAVLPPIQPAPEDATEGPTSPDGVPGPFRTADPPDSLPEAPKGQIEGDGDADRPLSRRRDYNSLRNEYPRLYRSIELRPAFDESARWHVSMIRQYRKRYERAGDARGVPWYFIACTHSLESSFNFKAHLHNGDYPLSSRTRQVPSGRPRIWLPPSDWESSARDALSIMGFTGQSDWSLSRLLYRLEAYNGLGYRSYGVPTPYLWSYSNHYERGKFVADGRWSAHAKSKQCGAAVMLKLLEEAGEISIS
jgi:lysozyme family protein